MARLTSQFLSESLCARIYRAVVWVFDRLYSYQSWVPQVSTFRPGMERYSTIEFMRSENLASLIRFRTGIPEPSQRLTHVLLINRAKAPVVLLASPLQFTLNLPNLCCVVSGGSEFAG